jgi:DNA-directed RNA polymerase alpha subunit
MLNIKKLRFQLDDSVEPVQWVFQKFSGIGLYTSKHLKLPSGITVFDEDTYLFEITDPSVELMIDMRIEKGYGYYSIDFLRKREQKKSDSDINILLIDNDFKATEYVKYHVQEVIDDFSGSTKDALILEIKSLYKGISPQQLLSFS